MKLLLTAWLSGLLFAFGLGVSGMTIPSRVVGFLDVFGHWDPSLAFVMVGAIGVHFFLYKRIKKKDRPRFAQDFRVPTRRDLTLELVLGSAIFGIGWGLAGYCPGPALTSIGYGAPAALVFVLAMATGMGVFHWVVDKRRKQK